LIIVTFENNSNGEVTVKSWASIYFQSCCNTLISYFTSIYTLIYYFILKHLYELIVYAHSPLMVSTQRLTSLAYNIADGRLADESKLSKSCKSLAVKYDLPFYNLLLFIHIKVWLLENYYILKSCAESVIYVKFT